MQVILIIALICFLACLLFGNIKIGGYQCYGFTERLIPSLIFGVIFGIFFGLPILGLISLFT